MEFLSVFIARIFGRGSVFLVLLVLAQVLSITELGYYGLVITTSYSVMFLGSLGMRHASAYFIGRSQARLPSILSITFFMAVLMGSIAALGLYIYYLNFQSDIAIGNIPIFAAVVVIPLLITFVLQGVYLGVGDFKRFNRSEILPRGLLLLSIGALYLLGVPITLELALWVFIVTGLIGSSYVIFSQFRMNNGVSYLPFAPLFPMIKYGFPLTLSLFFVILMPLTTMFFLERTVGGAALGVFYMAYKITDIFGEAATSVGMVSFSRGVRSEDMRETLLATLRVVWVVMFLSILVVIFLSPMSIFIIDMLVPDASENAASIFIMVLAALPFLCFSRIINPALAAQGYARYGAYIQFFSVIVNILLAWLLYPNFGVLGVLGALFVARLFSFLVLSIMLSKILDLNFVQVIIPNKFELLKIIEMGKQLFLKKLKKMLT